MRTICALYDGLHHHEQLEGNKTKKAQQWPQQLCKAILESALEEMKSQVIRHAFPAEFEMEERQGTGYMDGVHDLDDVAEQVHKRRRIDLNALDTEEDHEQSQDRVVNDLLHQKEKLRKEKWLKISRDERIAIRRLHQMMGHCSNQALVRMLRMSLAKKEIIDAAQHFRCQSCDEMKSDERPRTVRPINPCHQIKFNDELAADVFEVVDCKGARHSILSLLDMSTHYHVAVRVAPGGTPSSKICAEAINASWLSWAGAPRSFVCDQGIHNRGRVAALLQSLGTEIRRVGARAPHQLGIAERHGGMLKEMMKRGIHDRQLFGSSVIAALCSECARAKNVLVNNQGFSPAQWVLGHTPEDLSSLTDQDPENHLDVRQGLVAAKEKTPQEQFMLQLLMRQTAKEMYTQVDSSQRIRRALLRKAVPIRGPYHTGDLVCFSKQGKWYGPARVLTIEGKSSLWLVHGGVTVLVAEISCRPASTQEILKKHVLELRPARKRKRELLYSSNPEEEDCLPFADDGDEARALRQRTEQQAPFVDLQDHGHVGVMPTVPAAPAAEPTTEVTAPGTAATPEALMDDDSPEDAAQDSSSPSPLTPPPGLEQNAEDILVEHSGTSDTSSLQPEFEASPGVTPEAHEQEVPPSATPLTQALRLDPDRLDGITPPRANHVYDECARQPSSLAFLMGRQEHRVKKKAKKAQRTKKAGAGRELVYEKESKKVQEKLDGARRKEWDNWTKYTDGKWLTEEKLQELKKEIPGLRVIPTDGWTSTKQRSPKIQC